MLEVQLRNNAYINTRSSCRRECWLPPNLGNLKLNYYASVLDDDGSCVGSGVVLRDSYGNLVLTVRDRVMSRLRPCVVELVDVITGLEVVIQGGWQVESVETDCIEAVRLVNGEVANCFAKDGVLVENVRVLLALACANGVGFNHVPS
ncbi:hypothetical protein ACLB2K_015035 [Fragaria x ananassa]